jgi:hypothetical protein
VTDSNPPLLIAPPPPGWAGRPVVSDEGDRLARRGLVLGVVSFAVNPLLLASIIGIVYGRKALRLGTTRRSEAIAGIVTGAVSGGLIVLSLAVLLPISLILRNAAATELQHGVESSIVTLASHQGVTLTDVTCPAPREPQTGTVLDCTAIDGSSGTVQVRVTFTSPTTFTARVLPAGSVG